MTTEKNSHSIRVAGSVAISKYENTLIKRGLNDISHLNRRELHFSEIRSLGWIYIRKHLERQWEDPFYSQAQGSINIPEGYEVKLEIADKDCQNECTALLSMKHNDFQCLSLRNLFASSHRPIGLLDCIEHLTGIEELIFGKCRWMTNEDLVHFARYTNLVYIDLHSSNITDGIRHFQASSGLQRLDLDNVCESLKGSLRYLGAFKMLQWLDISFTEIDIIELKILAELPNLEMLGLASVRCRAGVLTPTQIADIKTLTPEEWAAMSREQQLAHVNRMHDSIPTSLGDEAIEHLCKLTNLKALDIYGACFSDQGLLQLKASLPNCQIGDFFI